MEVVVVVVVVVVVATEELEVVLMEKIVWEPWRERKQPTRRKIPLRKLKTAEKSTRKVTKEKTAMETVIKRN